MGDSSDTVRREMKSPIDYRVLILIGAAGVLYQIVAFVEIEFFPAFSPTDGAYLLGIAACSVSAFIVSQRYRGSEVFGKAYFFLGLSFLAWFIGDSMWYYYNLVLEQDPYPAPFDAFFMGFYGLALAHIILNTRYFRRSWPIAAKTWLVVLPIVIVATYLLVAYEAWGEYEELAFDLFYGTIFVAGAAVLLAFAVFGASVFRQSVLGVVWLLLAIGIFMSGVADVWYYFVEIHEEYDETHPLNTLWMLAFMVIVYALYKHQKAL